jgi:hypothetical protein
MALILSAVSRMLPYVQISGRAATIRPIDIPGPETAQPARKWCCLRMLIRRHSEVRLSESGDALIHARWIEYQKIQSQRLAYPKSLGRMVREVIVSQAMDKRPEPVGLDSVEDCRQRLPIEVNFVLRYGMWSNWPICHLPYKDDIDKVTRALRCLQLRVKLLSGGTF